MKPDPDVTGVPFNFDAIPMKLFPGLWDETKKVRMRGLWFILLYTFSTQIFFSIFMFFGAILFSRSLGVMLLFSLIIGIPIGIVIGLASWWDFTRKCKKL
jgi:uncharacterized integral membrane protein